MFEFFKDDLYWKRWGKFEDGICKWEMQRWRKVSYLPANCNVIHRLLVPQTQIECHSLLGSQFFVLWRNKTSSSVDRHPRAVSISVPVSAPALSAVSLFHVWYSHYRCR